MRFSKVWFTKKPNKGMILEENICSRTIVISENLFTVNHKRV